MTSRYPRLWSPMAIGQVTIRNRVVLTGHGTRMVKDGEATAALRAYYGERAKGGAGLLMIGTQQVHPSSPGLGHLLCNYDDTIIPSLASIAGAVHRHGAKLFGYIGHFGAFAGAYPAAPWAPSALYNQSLGSYAHAMSRDEIGTLVNAHAKAALRNLEAGLDGIEVHAGHGLLLNQFLSPLTNQRDDDYGGTLDNRMRFPLEVLVAVRRAVGPDIPLGVRISGEELIEGGLKVDDMTVVVQGMVRAAAIDFVDVSMGNDSDDMSAMLHLPLMDMPSAPYAGIARAIGDAVAIPIIHGTRIDSPEVAERLLESGAADFAGMCRGLIADPHLPNKARDGRADEITPCVGCDQACIGHLENGLPISCVGNPATGREIQWGEMRPAASRKKVVVVGGGPAGMEAAAVAAARGHAVTLFESQAALGGALRIAARAPNRRGWLRLVDAKARRLAMAGVDVRLSTCVDLPGIQMEKPDAIVVATGALAPKPDLPGTHAHVLTDRDVLTGAAEARGDVVVLDFLDSTSGIGVASFLRDRGHSVVLVTSAARLGERLVKPTRIWLSRVLHGKGVTVLTEHRVVRLDAEGVTLAHLPSEAQTVLRGVGTVVVAGPPRSDQSLLGLVHGLVAEVYVIGDGETPRDVEAAILEGHATGHAL